MAAQVFIPQDIVQGILTQLPVKTLIRFKCLSKHYCSLIENPNFISSHLNNSIKNPSLLAFSLDKNFKISPRSSFHSHETIINEISIPSGLDHLYVMGCCHGLVCFEYFDPFPYEFSFVMWNPATRKFKRLPKHNDLGYNCNERAFGFGFDPKGNDYKFLRASICGQYPIASIMFDVFERNKGRWRRIKYDNPNFVPPIEGSMPLKTNPNISVAAVQGALYWNIGNYILLSFSLLDDSFQWIAFPLYNRRLYRLGTFCAWKESIAALVYLPDHMSDTKSFDIWVLDGTDHKNRVWSKLFTNTCLVCRSLRPLCIWRDRDVVFEQRISSGKELLGLDIHGGQTDQQRTLFKESEKDIVVGVWNYEESLVSV